MKSKTQFTLVIIALATTGYSQKFSNMPLNVSYQNYNIGNHGLKVGSEVVWWSKDKEKQKKKRLKTKRKEFLQTGNFGYYFYKKSEHGLFLNTEAAWRKTNTKGFQYGIYGGIGAIQLVNAKPTYVVEGAQNIKVSRFSNTSGLYNLSFSLGQDLAYINKAPIKWWVKPNLYLQAPYNVGARLFVLTEIGVSFQLKKPVAK